MSNWCKVFLLVGDADRMGFGCVGGDGSPFPFSSISTVHDVSLVPETSGVDFQMRQGLHDWNVQSVTWRVQNGPVSPPGRHTGRNSRGNGRNGHRHFPVAQSFHQVVNTLFQRGFNFFRSGFISRTKVCASCRWFYFLPLLFFFIIFFLRGHADKMWPRNLQKISLGEVKVSDFT